MNDDVYVVVKYDYTAQEDQELTIHKNERLKLLDDSRNWWKVSKLFFYYCQFFHCFSRPFSISSFRSLFRFVLTILGLIGLSIKFVTWNSVHLCLLTTATVVRQNIDSVFFLLRLGSTAITFQIIFSFCTYIIGKKESCDNISSNNKVFGKMKQRNSGFLVILLGELKIKTQSVS